jgi:carotenoid 1,2-hydratase
VALYGPGARRWTMTERGRGAMQRDAHRFVIGPSRLHWDGQALTITIDEVGMPLPRRVRGTVRVVPAGLSTFTAPLDDAGRHRWGPIAPAARVEVSLDEPALRWQGHGYLDSNEGDEPIAQAFSTWDWARAPLADGGAAVVYDVRQRGGAPDRVIAARFGADGHAEPFDPPPRGVLPASAWRVARQMRSEAGVPPRLAQTLEDTPFYVRSVVDASWLGEELSAVHESLDCRRLDTAVVRAMLPFRMPRRA